MSRLDDAQFVLRNDPKGIYDLCAGFPEQCARALDIARNTEIAPLKTQPTLVILSGLGGSAAGGDFARALFDAEGKAPFLVNRDYSMPTYVGVSTLVFAVSYSGNTEETLAAYDDAKARGAQIIAVTSGGQLAEKATADGFTVISIPAGQPPRTALGFLLVPVVYASEKLGLIGPQDYDAALAQLRNSLAQYGIDSPFVHNQTKQLAEAIHGKLPLIYGLGAWQGIVGGRWKGQINENAKTMTFANTFPELCHNEIIGWVGADKQGVKQWVTILLKDGTESAKMTARAKVTLGLVADKSEQHTVVAPGKSLLEKMLALTYFGDFVSLYLAALNDVDPENIDFINTLKAQLADVP
jgi:glucose/mannose-6-phosphate isomerase